MPRARTTFSYTAMLFTLLEVAAALALLACYRFLPTPSPVLIALWAGLFLVPFLRLFGLIKGIRTQLQQLSLLLSALLFVTTVGYLFTLPAFPAQHHPWLIYISFALAFCSTLLGLKPYGLRWLYAPLTFAAGYAILWQTHALPYSRTLLYALPGVLLFLLLWRQQRDQILKLKDKINTHRTRVNRLVTEAKSHSQTAQHLRASQRQLERAVQARTHSLEQLNQALTLSTERLTLALKASDLTLWDWNIAANTMTYVEQLNNPTHTEKGGLVEQLAPHLNDEDKREIHRKLEAHLQGDTPHFKAVYAVASATEEPQWFHDEGQVVERHAVTGKAVRMLGLRKNITAEMMAQERQRFAAAVFDAASEGVVVFDSEYRILTVNERFTIMTGYSFDELVNTRLSALASQDANAGLYQSIREALDAENRWEGELTERRKDGDTYPMWVQITALFDEVLKRTHYVALCSDRTEEKRVEERVRFLSHFDRLTGLANRSLFHDRLHKAITLARLNRDQVALIAIDLDRFKPINDTMGSHVGDMLLQQVAKRLLDCGIHQHQLARIGGDEFTVLIDHETSRAELQGLCTNILQSIRSPFFIDGHELLLGASIGVATFPAMAKDAHSLIYKASLAVEQAKHLGGNNAFFYHEGLRERTKDQLSLEAQLHKAISNNELLLYYQPKWSLKEIRVTGVEALVRWHHPELGLQSPAQFITIAEEVGLIETIGEWVLNTACAEIKEWHSQGLEDLSVSVNLSAFQLRRGDLPELIKEALRTHQLPADKLDLELTESLIMENLDDNIAQLQAIRQLGVSLSLDDFGTGYSSLSYLKRFPINTLKIDRSFITDIEHSAQDCAITQAIIDMAHNLDMQVVAEGVETQRQLEILTDMGCDIIQGYYISRPLPEAEIRALLLQQRNAVAPIQSKHLPH